MSEQELAYSFTKRELDVLWTALYERSNSLRDYVIWIDDNPMLPERQLAIDNIKKEKKEVEELFVKIYDYRSKTMTDIQRP